MADQPIATEPHCEHYWQLAKGAHSRVWVRNCTLCHEIDWPGLNRQIRELAAVGATRPAAPTAAVIEIFERDKTTDDTLGGSVIAPTEIRINGHPVAAPADKPVVVHEISMTGDDLVQVTLTLFARRVGIRAEGDQP